MDENLIYQVLSAVEEIPCGRVDVYKRQGYGSSGRTDVFHTYIQLPDTHESDDAFHGICNDNNVLDVYKRQGRKQLISHCQEKPLVRT